MLTILMVECSACQCGICGMMTASKGQEMGTKDNPGVLNKFEL